MQTISHASTHPTFTSAVAPESTRQVWTGRALSTIAVLFLIFDSLGKLLQVQPVLDGTAQLGYPLDVVFSLGVIQLTCVVLYLFPRTSVIGALLLTGYLGGARVIHVRVANTLFTHVLFPTYVSALLWGGLALRDRRLREFLPAWSRP